MTSLWKHYNPEYSKYEKVLPHAYGWNRDYAAEHPRYVLGEDGYWYNPSAVSSDTALISCTGDLMCEPRMTNAHRYGDSYFFHPLFSYVRDIFRASDFCIANLETTLGEATPYAGDYHCIGDFYHCNAPVCYLDAVRYAGFDALVTANNHNCDAGIGGLWDTLCAIDEHKFMRTGSFLPSDRERVLLVKICGFRVAILSYGNRYNGIDDINFTKEGRDVCLNWFSKEKCLRDVSFAKEHGAEFILCYQHWGRDYDLVPNEQQLRILDEIRNCGVDYIVGSHTHCLQSHNVATADDGRQIPMMWSMGNFVTNERKELCKHTGILQLTLERKNGKIEVLEHLIPCYVFDEFGTGRFCVVPTDTTLNGGYSHPRMQEINDYIRARVGEDIAFLPDRSLDLSTLCEVMGIENTLDNRPVTKLCVGSATLCHSSVYFTLKEITRTDMRRLFAANVSAVVTKEPIQNLPCLVVSDVGEAYRKAYTMQRSKCDKTSVILVAGHINKTVTRELTARALRTVGGVYTIRDGEHADMAPWQDIHPFHKYCVLEVRDDHPLGVREAAALMRPDSVIITSMPCDAQGIADSLVKGGKLFYNKADTELCEAVSKLSRKDIEIYPYGDTVLSCDALPFEFMNSCSSAALEVALCEGANEKAVAEAISGYTTHGYNQSVMFADGVNIITNTNCKTVSQALATVKAAPQTSNKIAVTTPTFADAINPWATKMIIVDENNGFNTAVETLLKELQEGDTLVLCGERDALLCQVLRRMFGITDGYLPNCS